MKSIPEKEHEDAYPEWEATGIEKQKDEGAWEDSKGILR